MKRSTADVYAAFDERETARRGYVERLEALRAALAAVSRATRSRGAAAERPRVLAARRRAARAGSVSGRRQRRRAGRLRALPARPPTRAARRACCAVSGAFGSPCLRGTVESQWSARRSSSMVRSRPGRWLRERRLRITLWIAAIEGLLYLFGVLHWWAAFVLALIAVGFWWFVGRRSRSDSVRQSSWIFAASQLLVLCVPDRPLAREGGRDRSDRPARDRRADLPVHRAFLEGVGNPASAAGMPTASRQPS